MIGCTHTPNITSRAAPLIVTQTVRAPLYPSDAVMTELQAKVTNPFSPVWTYMHDDLANKCGQERDRGEKCDGPG